jgi:hypothetical protein
MQVCLFRMAQMQDSRSGAEGGPVRIGYGLAEEAPAEVPAAFRSFFR